MSSMWNLLILPWARQVVAFGCYDVSAVQAKQSFLSWRLEVLSDRLNDFSSPQTLNPFHFTETLRIFWKYFPWPPGDCSEMFFSAVWCQVCS